MSDETGEAPQEQQQQAHGGDSSPGVLSGAKGWITGLTSLAVAATAMFAAFGNLFGGKSDPAPQTAVSTSAEAAAATPTAAAATEEEGLPTVYTGDKIRMEWNGKTWELSSADGHFSYEEMLSPDDNWVLAYDKTEGEYMRWPIKGGTMEYSADDRQSWITYAEVAPEE
jgi:hypothetical protein